MSFIRDIRQAWRLTKSRPAFSTVVVLTLGLAIGAASLVFSLFDSVLLRPYPYRDAHELVQVRTHEPNVPGSRAGVSVPDFEDWRRSQRSLSSLAAYVSFANNLTGMGPARPVRMTFATSDLFTVLDVAPAAGQTFTAQDDALGGDVRKAVLSHSLWMELFNGDRAAIGRTIQLRGEAYVVVGVMPPGFAYPDRTQVWVPLMARYASTPDPWWKRRDSRPHTVLARLAPGVSVAQAQSDMDAIVRSLASQFRDMNRDTRAEVVTLREAESGEIRPYVLAVGAAVLLLLLIGCVNVANLLVARAASREKEFALRAALGSTFGDLARQLIAESALFGLLGGAFGVALAMGGVRVLQGLLPAEAPPWMSLTIDARVLLFALAVSLGTALLFGLAPLMQHFRADLNEVLKQGSKGSSGSTSLAQRLRRGLVIAEVALSMTLLISAGLMLRSFWKLMQVDTGVKTDRLIVATVSQYLPNLARKEATIAYANEYKRIADALAGLPGVALVGGGNDLHYLNQPEQRTSHDLYTKRRATRDEAYRGPTQGADVMPGYFAALGIPIIEGRDFNEADTTSSYGVMIVNRHAAQTLFPGESAVGQQIRWGNNDNYDPWMTIIGVVGDTKWQPAERTPGFDTYWSYRQYSSSTNHLLIRTTAEPAALIPQIRRTIREMNPGMAIQRVEPMARIADDSVWQRRLWGVLLGVFAGLALTLAAIGLYGVMSYLVTLQTREIGIRMAIGAPREKVLGLILGKGMSLVAAGGFVGLAAAFGLAQLLGGLLFGLSPSDPLTYAIVTLALGIVSAVACALPAWRASRVDPLIALREE